MIRCEERDGHLTIITDDADAECYTLDQLMEGTEWESEFAATRMDGPELVWMPTLEGPAIRDMFIELVGLKPGDEMKHGFTA